MTILILIKWFPFYKYFNSTAGILFLAVCWTVAFITFVGLASLDETEIQFKKFFIPQNYEKPISKLDLVNVKIKKNVGFNEGIERTKNSELQYFGDFQKSDINIQHEEIDELDFNFNPSLTISSQQNTGIHLFLFNQWNLLIKVW